MTTSTKIARTADQIAASNAKRAATIAAKALAAQQEKDTLAALELLAAQDDALLAALNSDVEPPAAVESVSIDASALVTVEPEVNQSFAAKLATVLQARNAEVYSNDTALAIKYVQKSSVAIDACMSRPHFAEQASALLKNARNADNKTNKRDFIAVKVLVKIAHILCAIGQGIRSEIDNHTLIIAYQMLKNANLLSISAKVAQSKRITFGEFGTVQELDYRHTANYSVGTTSTQTSSSCMVFNYCGFCNIVKGEKDRVISFADNQRSRDFALLFA